MWWLDMRSCGLDPFGFQIVEEYTGSFITLATFLFCLPCVSMLPSARALRPELKVAEDWFLGGRRRRMVVQRRDAVTRRLCYETGAALSVEE